MFSSGSGVAVLRCLDTSRSLGLLGAGLCAALLGGCVEAERSGWISSSKTDAASLSPLWRAAPNVDATLERAPEQFRASGMALWDGKRTARGVWVAHPQATASRRVRIVNTRTGGEVDGMLYRPGKATPGDAVTISSDAATALGLGADKPTLLSIFGVRSVSSASLARAAAPAPVYGASAAVTAQSELANHIGRMDPNQTLQLAAAAIRGMGYATVFEAPSPEVLPEIRAFAAPGSGPALSAIRVQVRAAGAAPVTAADLQALQARVKESGDIGVMISIPGFTPDAGTGLAIGGGHVEMVDLDGLLAIWTTHYETLSDPDRALLRLQPIYFLARE